MKEENITWRSWWDGGDTTGPIASQFHVEGWPTFYVIDHAGTIRHKWIGTPREGRLDLTVDKLIEAAEANEANIIETSTSN